MSPARRRLLLAGFFLAVILVLFELWAYDVIKIDFISFMEIQPSFDVQEHPLPVPARSIPIEGPAYIPNMGAPENPVPADDISISRGNTLFQSTASCAMGRRGKATAGCLYHRKTNRLT